MNNSISKTPSTAADPTALVLRQEEAVQQLGLYVGQLAGMMMALQQEVEHLKRDNARRVTINHQQAKGLAARIRDRATAVCDKYRLDARMHGAFFRSAIKKAVLQGYGIQDLHDIPLQGLEMVMQQVDGWVPGIALVRKRREIEAQKQAKEVRPVGPAD